MQLQFNFILYFRFIMAYNGGGLNDEELNSLSKASGDVINEKIASVGDFIRELKSKKASKDQIQVEVQVLLKLKGIFKSQTGKDWVQPKPGSTKQKEPSPPKVEAYTGGGLKPEEEDFLKTAAAEALDAKIKSCGDLIRKMKEEKASKDDIKNEVQVLLTLKTLYKNKTGEDWKPSEQPKQESKKKTAESTPKNDQEPQEKSDKQLKREQKKAEKQAKKAQHKGANEESKQTEVNEGEDVSMGKYGVSKMNQSQNKPNIRLIENFSILTEKLDNQTLWVRARLHTSRAKGKFHALLK